MTPTAHDAQCESELTSHGYTACLCSERKNESLTAERDQLLTALCEATNGWACYAKRKIEHDEITRLHGVIAKSRRQP